MPSIQTIASTVVILRIRVCPVRICVCRVRNCVCRLRICVYPVRVCVCLDTCHSTFPTNYRVHRIDTSYLLLSSHRYLSSCHALPQMGGSRGASADMGGNQGVDRYGLPLPQCAYICIYTHTHAHTHTHAQSGGRQIWSPPLPMCIYMYIYTHTHTYTHLITHKQTHIHTHTLPWYKFFMGTNSNSAKTSI